LYSSTLTIPMHYRSTNEMWCPWRAPSPLRYHLIWYCKFFCHFQKAFVHKSMPQFFLKQP